MAAAQTKWVATKQFGMAGLVTQDDPQFIDEHAMPSCLNVVLDDQQLAPRKGTHLLYPAPTIDKNTPEQLFKFTSNNGTEFLLNKFEEHWYVLDTTTNNWVMIGTQDSSDPLYTGATWHNIFYSNDMINNVALFAPTDYSNENSADGILLWPSGVAHLTVQANPGDTSLTVDDATAISFPSTTGNPLNVGGDQISGIAGSSLSIVGTLTANSPIVVDIADTSAIEVGASISGSFIPSGTTVLNIIDANSITLSKDVVGLQPAISFGSGDSHSNTTIDNLNIGYAGTLENGTGPGVTTQPSIYVAGSDVQLFSGVTYGITGSGISGGTTITVTSVYNTAYFVVLGVTSNNPLPASGACNIYSIINVGDIITGSGIQPGTTIASLTGSAPAYTGLTLSDATTSSVTGLALTFESSPQVTLTVTDKKHIILASGAVLTNTYPIGTPITSLIQNVPQRFPQGNVVLIWNNSVAVATAQGNIQFSYPADPLFSKGIFIATSNIGGRIKDMRAFGQFFIAGGDNQFQIGQKIASSDLNSVGVLFTPYISGQGMGPISAQGTILFNNTYYYPTTTNGIIALTPNFTGTSSSSGVEVLTDPIHNFLRTATFLRAFAINRKLYWIISFPGTPEEPQRIYQLVYDMIRQAFTLADFEAIDGVLFENTLCFLGTDGDVYQGEYDSYEDQSEDGTDGYLVEAYSPVYDMGEPSLPKDSQYCMVQGKLLQGTTMYVDVMYNEGGSLGKTRYQIKGDTANEYFALPDMESRGNSPSALVTYGGGNLSVGIYRVYLSLNKSFKWHNYQLRFYTEKAGAYFTVGIVSPNVEVSTLPTNLVISPS